MFCIPFLLYWRARILKNNKYNSALLYFNSTKHIFGKALFPLSNTHNDLICLTSYILR